MYNTWIRGIAGNPAATADVLVRLLDTGWLDHHVSDRELPAEVIDAILSRGTLTAQYHLSRNPCVDPEQRARTVDIEDADPGRPLVRRGLMCGPNQWFWPRPLPLPAVERAGLTLDFERDKQLIDDTRTGTAIAGSVVLSFWNHREPRLRAWSCLYWPRMSDAVREALLADPDPGVRARAEDAAHPFTTGDFDYTTPMEPEFDRARAMTADEQWRHSRLRRGCVSREVVDHILAGRPVDDGQRRQWHQDLDALSANPAVPLDCLRQLLTAEYPVTLAARQDLTPDFISALATHANEEVRRQLVLNPLLCEEERVAVKADFSGENEGFLAMPGASMMDIQEWPPTDMDRLISQATSTLPRVRRVAAGNRFLPSEYVARLADDDDPGVRLALCLRHPEAPSSLLVRTWLECPAHRSALMTRPDFPTEVTCGMSVHADDPDPDVRILATYDPALPSDLADQLSHDTDRLVRTAAIQHPNLPLARIRELLTEPSVMHGFVEAAAANPSLPVEDMHHILDEQLARGGS